ncbi:gp2 [Burkholderia phage KS14]|uniref:Gp2 n=2 Tax=Kisquattuordecimvirus TaxID=2732982 RepID=E5FFF5_9CAUD|nr:DNA primase [Burkholderia phage KS14]ADP02347.1 gp2 [Burkholderia phage KS14]
MASITELKRRVDLHELADRLGIKKGKGGEKANYHSPHTTDKVPSLSIFPALPEKGEGWKDHSTGKGGSCIDLVMYVQGCDVSEAMRYLHEAFGIPFDTIDKPAEQTRTKTAIDYIAERSIEHREKARDYLKSRGIADAAIDRAFKCKTAGFNDWTSPKRPAGEVGHGGPAAVFLVHALNGSQLVAADMRYIDPALNGGVKTQTQGEKDGHGWTADPRKLHAAHRVVIVESAINALSVDSCGIPGTAAYALRGIGNVDNIDFTFLRGKQVVICLDNDDVIADDKPRAGERPGPDAACKLYERLTALNIACILIDQAEWVKDLADGSNKTESINDVNDYLQLRGADELRKALDTYEQWLIPGMAGDTTRKGKPRVFLPSHDFAQYWRFRSRLDFSTYIAKAGETEDDAPTHIDLAGFRVASFSRVSVASASSTMTGDPDNSPTVYFAVTVQTPRHGADLTRSVLNDKQIHNLTVWNQFGPIWEPKRFSRMVTILERTAHLGARNAANYVGLAWRDGRLVVNEGPDCYFTNAEQQCPYHNLTFPSGTASDAARVIGKYQETFKDNAAALALVWGLGGHLKALLGFWPHMMMQADKSAGKSTLIKALERTIGFTMFSGQSLQTEFRLLTSISHTSHPVGWEELSARKQDVIDKAVGLLQENYQYTITKRGSEMTEYVLSAPVLLAGEDVPVRSLHGKLVRTNLTGKKGPMLPRDLPRFPVRQWLQYLAELDRDTVLDKYDELRAHCLKKSCGSGDDEGGKRMASNYAALLLAWSYLCDFAGIPTNAGAFGDDVLAEMNRHIAETSADRSPWVWILETALSEIDSGAFKHPYKFDDVEGEDCLLVRPAHIMDHIAGSNSLREKWNALPVKTPAVFRRQLLSAGVAVGDKEIERTIHQKRVQHLTPLSLKRLAGYGLSVARNLNHVHEN